MPSAHDNVDLVTLYGNLTGSEKTFDAIGKRIVTSAGASSVRRFKIAVAMAVLLAEPSFLLPSIPLRLAALYALSALYDVSPILHPFLATLLSYARSGSECSDETRLLPEHWLAAKLVTGDHSFAAHSSPDVVSAQMEDPTKARKAWSFVQDAASELQGLVKQYEDSSGRPLPRPSPLPDGRAKGDQQSLLQEAIVLFTRIYKEAPAESTLHFLNILQTPEGPGSLREAILAERGTMSESPRLEASRLLADRAADLWTTILEAAQSAPLPLDQQQSLVQSLDDATLVNKALTPAALPLLVENNPNLAFELLVRLLRNPPSPEATATPEDYLSALLSVTMSLHSLEVVNRLASATPLPSDFLRMYVVRCIATCDQTRDRYLQNRQVRLVCVFLQSLIRNKTISIADFFVDIQAFCIQFSRIREAAGLFRLLKKEEPDPNAS
ncbi:hypothetical protein HKX48_003747 [Thoreauomyces humboldtii]|nr:hypothetical protein HKX48_003747 [Thoreauomyces humboldtii]